LHQTIEHFNSQGLREPLVIPRLTPLLNVVGYILALTIHDDIFATELKDIEQVYRIDIPQHANDIKLEVKISSWTC
jgi:hypothetical protein